MSRKSRSSAVAGPSLRGLWALGFVVMAIIALVAVPIHFDREMSETRDRMSDLLDPAAALSSNLRLLKARQLARMEGFLATRDPSFREPYNAAIAEEDSVLQELQELARELDLQDADPEVDMQILDRFARVTNESMAWRVTNEGILDADSVLAGSRQRMLDGFDAMQSATRELDVALNAEVDEADRDILNQEREQARITLALAIMAVIATLILGRVAHRYRNLTIEREVRRREAVRARREIDALLEATGDGVLGIDLSGRCISLNRAGSALLGFPEGEIIGRDVHDTVFHTAPDGSRNPREGSLLLHALGAGRPLESEDEAIIWRRKNVSFPARWSLRPMIDGRELRGGVLSFTDMTEIHEKEDALRLAIQQREDVVSIVSHDLRNPLGVALAAADLLLDLPLDEQQRRRQAQIIRRSGKRMQHLIEDLLDLSRIEAGALVVRPSKEELAPILEEAREMFADQASARGLTLEVAPAVGKPVARVDRDRIIQALTNLLDNAVRLTPEGGRVTMSVRTEGSDVLVAVEDTGPGVHPDMIEHLFDRFTMAAGQQGGSVGLGLTIVKGVVDAHDGDVTVKTERDHGSVFVMRLPITGPAVGEVVAN